MDEQRDERLTAIAKKYLSLATLETRNAGHLDFREQAVWSIKAALESAYRAGYDQAKQEHDTTREQPLAD